MTKEPSGPVGNGCAWTVVLLVALVALGRCMGAGDDAADAETAETAYVTASALNCRSSAGTSAAIVETIPFRSRVIVTETQGDWGRLDRSTGCWVSRDFLSSSEPPAAVSTHEPQPLFSQQQAPMAPARSCGAAPYCYEMSSCSEAQFYYQQCGVGRLDGDNDGIPCEELC